MKRNLLICFYSLFLIPAIAQKKIHPASIQITLGRSTHGTGDIRGIYLSTEYGHFINRHIELAAALATTINSGGDNNTLSISGNNYDNSFRYTTAGIQGIGKIGYAPVNTINNQIKLSGGVLLRYQSSSLPNSYGTSSPAATGLPEPVYTFRNENKQNTITIGYAAEAAYIFKTGRNILLGIKAGFQNDTAGDVITHIAFIIGKGISGIR